MDHYAQINVSPHATTEEILDRCDLLSQGDLEQQLEAAMAKTVLGDPVNRMCYDIEYLKARHPVHQMITQSQEKEEEYRFPVYHNTVNNYPDAFSRPVRQTSVLGFIFGCFIAGMAAVFVSFGIFMVSI